VGLIFSLLGVWRIALHSSLPTPCDFIPTIFGNRYAMAARLLQAGPFKDRMMPAESIRDRNGKNF
jgi:hypothetical protein